MTTKEAVLIEFVDGVVNVAKVILTFSEERRFFDCYSGCEWLWAAGASKKQLEMFLDREFKRQPLVYAWRKEGTQRKVVATIRLLSELLPPPFDAIDAVLRNPGIATTTSLPRLSQNISELRRLRGSAHLKLICASPVLLMHPESEFKMDECWTDIHGRLRNGKKDAPKKSKRGRKRQRQKAARIEYHKATSCTQK